MKYITLLEIFPSFTTIFAPVHTVDTLCDHKTGNDLKARAVRTIHVKNVNDVRCPILETRLKFTFKKECLCLKCSEEGDREYEKGINRT